MYGPDASRTVMGKVGLELAPACSQQLGTTDEKTAKLTDGRTITVLGHVTLLFKVGGIEKEVVVAIVPGLDED